MNSSNPASGALAGGFLGVAFKRISTVEAESTRSHQHEFNGAKALIDLLGRETPQRIRADFVWMPDDGAFVRCSGAMTWYDARARHPTRCEYRLYYGANAITDRAAAGDFLVIALTLDRTALVLMAPGSGLAEARIAYLFGIEASPGAAFAAVRMGYAQRALLETELGARDRTLGQWLPETGEQLRRNDGSIRESVRRIQAAIAATRSTDAAR